MEKIKQCCKCKEIRNINDFGKLKSSPDGLRYDCKVCRKAYRETNKDEINEKNNKYYYDNKNTLLEKNKTYRIDNTEIINEQRKTYRNRPEVKKHIEQKNKEYLPIKKEKMKEKRKTDLNFQLSEILRSKIHKILKGKTTSYQDIIGCDLEFLKKWIEFRFDKNMNWENLGTYWQIDHILPINMFKDDLEQTKYICFHWTNLQPLTTFENRSKSDKLQLHYYYNNIVNVNRFNSKYNKFLGYQIVNENLRWLRNNLRYGENSPDDNTIKVFEIGNQQPSL